MHRDNRTFFFRGLMLSRLYRERCEAGNYVSVLITFLGHNCVPGFDDCASHRACDLCLSSLSCHCLPVFVLDACCIDELCLWNEFVGARLSVIFSPRVNQNFDLSVKQSWFYWLVVCQCLMLNGSYCDVKLNY